MIRHLISEAFGALSHYKLRSALTMLSVTWGVAALVLLLSYGNGFESAVVSAFDQIGKDLFVVFPGQTSRQAGGERAGRRILLELRDVEALVEGVPTLEAISPEVRRFLPVSYGYRMRNYTVNGVYAAFGQIRQAEVARGRFLSEEDLQQRRRVAVIGADLKRELFSERPAVGSVLKINGVRFTVIGVLRKKTQITNYAPPDDLTALVPFTAFATMVNTRYLNDIVLRPASNQFRDRFLQEIRAALARQHKFRVRDERALTIYDWNEFRAVATGIGLGLKVLLTIIGSLTLSIGAVGVMNIMLMSVTERTREIGVLKALGARRRQVLAQILLEGLILMVVGGALGVLLAAGIVRAVGTLPLLGPLFEDTSGRSDIHLNISWSALALSSLVLLIVGLVAGIVPAVRAARLDPVQAIRSD